MNCKICKVGRLQKLGPLASFCETCGVLATGGKGVPPLLTSTCCPIGQPCQAHRIKIANAWFSNPEDFMHNRSVKMDDRTGDVELRGTFTVSELRGIAQIADEAKWGTS